MSAKQDALAGDDHNKTRIACGDLINTYFSWRHNFIVAG